MLRVTLVFGLAGAGKSALARHLLHDEHSNGFLCISDDDRTINFDSLFIDRDRSNWLADRRVYFKNGSAFGLSIERQLAHLTERSCPILAARARQVIVFSSDVGQGLKWLADTARESALKIERLVVVVDCLRYYKAHFKNALSDEDLELDIMIPLAHAVLLNKRDLCSKEIVNTVSERIKLLNENAVIEETRFGKANGFNLLLNTAPVPAV